MRGSGFSDLAKALWLFIGGSCLFLFIIWFLLVMVPTGCESQIEAGKEAFGARIYLNGQFLGMMENDEAYGDGTKYTKLCTRKRIRRGDILRAEKEGYQSSETAIDPWFNDSGPPYFLVKIKLKPLAQGEKTRAQ